MFFFILFLLLLNQPYLVLASGVRNVVSKDVKAVLTDIKKDLTTPENNQPTPSKQESKEIKIKPVNNGPIIPPFPIHQENESTWDKKLQEYIYSYQIRYGSIGDRFVLPEDIDAFLETLPHGTHDKPKVSTDNQNKIAISFDENYQQNVVDQYFRMQYRLLAQTLK